VRHAIALAALLLGAGCATFDGPPEVTIEGDTQGQLTDPHAPIVLDFSKPPVASTVKFEIARYLVDTEGNLADEDSDPDTQLDLLFSHDPSPTAGAAADIGGAAAPAKDGMSTTVTFDVVPPAATPLVLLVEPGLADATGAVTVTRRRIVFTYVVPLTCDAPVHVMRSGTYFMIALITKPVPIHVHLWAVVEVDPTTGHFKARFSKAKRNPDPDRCPMPCDATQVCRLLPAPMCVAPSEPAGSVDEYPDYVADPEPPTGFGFATTGCAVDQDVTTSSFVTAPADVVVQNPKVTLRNAALTASFTPDDLGVLRASGSLVADAVLLFDNDSGTGQGDLTARSVPDAEVPPGLPVP